MNRIDQRAQRQGKKVRYEYNSEEEGQDAEDDVEDVQERKQRHQ